jgi:Skp family chaperone for outer membrane proteins
MKSFVKISLAASLAAAGMVGAATPAQAQVNGIATSSPEGVVYNAQARVEAYRQIDTTYAGQLQQIATLRQEARTLSQGLDTNGDGNVSQAEADAQASVVQQIQQKQSQIEGIENPIALAQLYVIEQLLERYNAAQTQVIQQKGIKLMLVPDVFQYGAEQADVSADIAAALNAAVPTVNSTPPANFRPRRETIQVHQTINQLRLMAAQQAAAQQANQQPAQQQPSGR